VEASWETFRGPVAVRWRIEGTSFLLSVDIPPGITASVSLPASSAADKRTVSECGSGHHEFQVREFHR
jgi:hypothetical protein